MRKILLVCSMTSFSSDEEVEGGSRGANGASQDVARSVLFA